MKTASEVGRLGSNKAVWYFRVLIFAIPLVLAATAARAQTADAPIVLGDDGFFALSGGSPCTITNELAAFQIVSVGIGTNGYVVVFQSCSDHAYLIASADALSTNTAWGYKAAIVPGLDGTTGWTDSSLVNTNVQKRFYRVDRWWLNDSVGDGIPDWWRQFYFGTGTTTNAFTCATCDYDGDGVNNLTEYLEGRDPTHSATPDTSGMAGLVIFSPQE